MVPAYYYTHIALRYSFQEGRQHMKTGWRLFDIPTKSVGDGHVCRHEDKRTIPATRCLCPVCTVLVLLWFRVFLVLQHNPDAPRNDCSCPVCRVMVFGQAEPRSASPHLKPTKAGPTKAVVPRTLARFIVYRSFSSIFIFIFLY